MHIYTVHINIRTPTHSPTHTHTSPPYLSAPSLSLGSTASLLRTYNWGTSAGMKMRSPPSPISAKHQLTLENPEVFSLSPSPSPPPLCVCRISLIYIFCHSPFLFYSAFYFVYFQTLKRLVFLTHSFCSFYCYYYVSLIIIIIIIFKTTFFFIDFLPNFFLLFCSRLIIKFSYIACSCHSIIQRYL